MAANLFGSPDSDGPERVEGEAGRDGAPGAEGPWFGGRPAGKGWPDYQILTPADFDKVEPYRLSRSFQIYALLLPALVALLYFLVPVLLGD